MGTDPNIENPSINKYISTVVKVHKSLIVSKIPHLHSSKWVHDVLYGKSGHPYTFYRVAVQMFGDYCTSNSTTYIDEHGLVARCGWRLPCPKVLNNFMIERYRQIIPLYEWSYTHSERLHYKKLDDNVVTIKRDIKCMLRRADVYFQQSKFGPLNSPSTTPILKLKAVVKKNSGSIPLSSDEAKINQCSTIPSTQVTNITIEPGSKTLNNICMRAHSEQPEKFYPYFNKFLKVSLSSTNEISWPESDAVDEHDKVDEIINLYADVNSSESGGIIAPDCPEINVYSETPSSFRFTPLEFTKRSLCNDVKILKKPVSDAVHVSKRAERIHNIHKKKSFS